MKPLQKIKNKNKNVPYVFGQTPLNIFKKIPLPQFIPFQLFQIINISLCILIKILNPINKKQSINLKNFTPQTEKTFHPKQKQIKFLLFIKISKNPIKKNGQYFKSKLIIQDNISDLQRQLSINFNNIPFMQGIFQPINNLQQHPNKHQHHPIINLNKFQNKQDYPTNSQQNTQQKHTHKQNPITLNQNTTISKNIKLSKQNFKNKQRTFIINSYSKLQFYFNLQMESMFLAIDILDKYIELTNDTLTIEQFSKISLASFMLAIKYQEIYPPTFDNVKSKMKIQIHHIEHIKNQFKILTTLNFNLIFPSPIQYLLNIPIEITPQIKSFIFLYLQISSLNTQIKQNYTWQQIIQAIQIFILPINPFLENLTNNIQNCFYILNNERINIIDNQTYHWLYRKYSETKFHQIAKKPIFLGEDK